MTISRTFWCLIKSLVQDNICKRLKKYLLLKYFMNKVMYYNKKNCTIKIRLSFTWNSMIIRDWFGNESRIKCDQNTNFTYTEIDIILVKRKCPSFSDPGLKQKYVVPSYWPYRWNSKLCRRSNRDQQIFIIPRLSPVLPPHRLSSCPSSCPLTTPAHLHARTR